jgi:hypothetical protein
MSCLLFDCFMSKNIMSATAAAHTVARPIGSR